MRGEVRPREKVSYTLGLVGQNMVYNFVAMYIMFFFTDLVGMEPHVATVLVVVASLWDAVNDTIMGLIVDKTRTRWGKFRPYLVAGPPLIGAATVLCFTDFGLEGAAATAAAIACYVLWDMCYTVSDVPIWAISSVASTVPAEKDRLVTLGKIGGTVGTAIVTVASIMVINAFGGERTASAYTLAALVFVVLGCIPMLVCGLTMKERIVATGKAEPVAHDVQTITKNRPLMLLFASLLLVNMVNNLRQAGQMYFAVYVWGDSGQLTNIGISLILGMCVGMAVTPRLLERFEKQRVYIAACALGCASCAVPFFAGGQNVASGLVLLGVSFAFTGVTTIASMSMLMDGIDYSEWKLGFRGEGLVFSANTFLNKLSGTLAKATLGISLVLMAYVENQPVTPTTQTGFSALMYLVPAGCFLLALVPMLFYRIAPEERAEMAKMREGRGGR